ncbi:helix-turn-helix transcriptional regulator [Actinospica robiniae]|uniref:helix-turn-helix transcriptional regulator n=1 Tax=Actinospica robiniae TaxID=304901 RepID=UPI00055030DE|nr:helix-turn-helix transcriptional regulator [Actinospica robiniae]
MSVLLDTSRLPAADRAEALQAVLTGATAPHDLRLLDAPENIHARLEHWQLDPAVALLHQRSSGVSHTRTDRHARKDGPERVVFVLHDGGPGRYIHEERAYPLYRGALYVTDLNSCYSYARPGEGSARIIQIERAALGLSVEQVQSAAVDLQASPLYNLLRSHIAHLCAAAPTLTPVDRANLAPVTTRLAAALLGTTALQDVPGARQAADGYLVDRTILYMQSNYPRHELTAEEIAHEHGVSVRYLFQQWSTHPQTLAEALLDIRLAAARTLLTQQPHLPVNVVAHRCGFLHASHFTRRFQRAYGSSPTHYRQEVSRPVRS